MSYTKTVLRRLRLMVSREHGIPLAELKPGSKLGDPPIGLSEGGLTALRLRLNGEAVGFADVLRSDLSSSEISGNKKLSEVRDAIKARSWVSHIGHYRSMVQEVVRRSLSDRILAINPEAEITPTTQIPSVVGDENLAALRETVTNDLRKYLFIGIGMADLRRSFASSKSRIVGRTLIF